MGSIVNVASSFWCTEEVQKYYKRRCVIIVFKYSYALGTLLKVISTKYKI